MNSVRHALLALVLLTTAWPAAAGSDYFWNCTTPDGIKYADATQCDKGDTAVKVVKGSAATSTAPVSKTQPPSAEEAPAVNVNSGVCPSNPAQCTRPNYGVTEGSPRAQAIAQFMRKKECDFMQRFPERCNKPR